jgi:hypothetical protein
LPAVQREAAGAIAPMFTPRARIVGQVSTPKAGIVGPVFTPRAHIAGARVRQAAAAQQKVR